ncbi:MAG TPA: FkbM family methyltransferase [Solirubrobacteraceae bacterium]|nr:FkbM family methyltransferase [Solirubrobacteraceae bacterium]
MSGEPSPEPIELVEDLVYDVGAHKGEDSAYYLAKGYRVVAFEANAELVRSCAKRFASEIADGRLTLVEGAITDGDAPTVRFYRHPLSTWGTTSDEMVERNLMVAASEAVDVPAVRFAEKLRETGMPSFMKIDIEGSDMLCLQALLEFERRPRSVSVESHKTDWSHIEAEFAMLRRLGYDRFAVVQQGDIAGSTLHTQKLDGRELRFSFEEDSSGPFGSDVGPWLDSAAAIKRYKRVFLAYRLIGAKSLLRRTRIGRRLHGIALRRLKRPLPGWYDTHAARGDEMTAPTFAEGR